MDDNCFNNDHQYCTSISACIAYINKSTKYQYQENVPEVSNVSSHYAETWFL